MKTTNVEKECYKCGQEMHEIVTSLDRNGAQLPEAVRKGFFCFGCKCWLDVDADGR